jgi:2-C-methyl-D-erythritol 4-phosphate cytidylyltransferase
MGAGPPGCVRSLAMSSRDAPAPVWTVIVAGGGGTRFGGPKQYVALAGRRTIDWSLAAARSVSDGIVVVVPAEDVEVVIDDADLVVAGGDTRSESVRNGLAAVPDDAGIVLVHDAARPAASPALFRAVVDAVRAGAQAVVPGVAVTDSLRRRTGGAIDRDELVAVQTPQGFDAGVLRAGHASRTDASDDASVAEAHGATVEVVLGETTNVKLTHPADRIALEATLASRSGQGAPA